VLAVSDGNVEHRWRAEPPGDVEPAAIEEPKEKQKPLVWWLVLFDGGIVAGAWLAARLAGRSRILPKPPWQVGLAFLGGILLGVGAAFAGGCFYGHVVSGWALMSLGGVLFALTMVLSNGLVTYFYLMGGTVFRAKENR
jgi:hypothetical protein